MADDLAADPAEVRRLELAQAWHVSPHEWDGGALTETHEQFDADGIYVGYTIVTKHSPWTPQMRAEAAALLMHQQRKCPCGCGQPVEESHKKGSGWLVDNSRCQARAALTIAQRDAAMEAMPADQRPKDWKKGRMQPGDGLLWTVKPHTPEEA